MTRQRGARRMVYLIYLATLLALAVVGGLVLYYFMPPEAWDALKNTYLSENPGDF